MSSSQYQFVVVGSDLGLGVSRGDGPVKANSGGGGNGPAVVRGSATVWASSVGEEALDTHGSEGLVEGGLGKLASGMVQIDRGCCCTFESWCRAADENALCRHCRGLIVPLLLVEQDWRSSRRHHVRPALCVDGKSSTSERQRCLCCQNPNCSPSMHYTS